jgi:hypothetical protein
MNLPAPLVGMVVGNLFSSDGDQAYPPGRKSQLSCWPPTLMLGPIGLMESTLSEPTFEVVPAVCLLASTTLLTDMWVALYSTTRI